MGGETRTGKAGALRLPRHWIGVERHWQDGGDPFSRLVSLPPADLRTHAYVLGATGSGKTTLLHHLIAQDIVQGNSFAVLDLRGDLVAAVAAMLAGRVPPTRVRILDLRGGCESTGFDPLHGKGEPYFRALSVLKAVEAASESWGVQLAETLRCALMLLAEAGEPLTRIEAVLYDQGFLLSCLEDCRDEGTLGFWRRYLDLSETRRAALAAPVANKISLLLSTRTLCAALGSDRPLDMARHLDYPGSVLLVSLAGDETHGAGRMMGRIVLSSLAREIFARVRTPEGLRNPFRLYVDEFEHFGESEFEDLLAEGRRFGFSLVLAHQTLAQLTPRIRSMLLNNVGAKVVFRVGRDDARTMSLDLAGDARSLGLADQAVGEATLWTTLGGVVEIEVNAPIVRGAGGPDPVTERYLAEVARQSRAVVPVPRRARAAPEGGAPARREDAGGDDGAVQRRGGPNPLEDLL